MVLIDIDMPSCCADCPLYDDRWDYPTCYVTNSSRGYNFKIHELRMPDCPLHAIVRCEIRENVKLAKWVKTGQSFVFPNKFRNYTCSECGYDIEKQKYRFCPNCGADMRGE